MKTVNIIGAGNVAYHLYKALKKADKYKLQNVAVRSLEKAKSFVDEYLLVDDVALLKKADITIISVTDSAIESISMLIPYTGSLVVHTSGTTAMNVIDNKHKKGVFYPLQTFSKSKEIDFKSIPLCLEAESDDDLKNLKDLANSLSSKVYEISSQQRKSLHVAAVFVSNFTNHMYAIGEDICTKNNVSFDVLKPLIKETANKIEYLNPKDAQTGPAIRHDDKTLNAHKEFLSNNLQNEIYQLITKSIQENV